MQERVKFFIRRSISRRYFQTIETADEGLHCSLRTSSRKSSEPTRLVRCTPPLPCRPCRMRNLAVLARSLFGLLSHAVAVSKRAALAHGTGRSDGDAWSSATPRTPSGASRVPPHVYPRMYGPEWPTAATAPAPAPALLSYCGHAACLPGARFVLRCVRTSRWNVAAWHTCRYYPQDELCHVCIVRDTS